MKRNRRVLLVLWILSLVGISFHGGQITYGIFFMLTLIPILALLYIGLVVSLFKIYQNLEGKEFVCGRPTVFYFTLQNESPILFSGVRVRFFSSFSTISGLDDQTEYELRPYSGIKKRTGILFRYRGEYEVGIKTIEITDFLRLFTVSYRNREPLMIRVKPNIVELSELKSVDTSLSAVMDSRVNPTEPDLIMREYVRGDDPRLINWKATGASGKLMVRERIGEQQEGIGILFDPKRYGEENLEYLPLENKILETVIALNLFLSTKGIPVETWFLEDALEKTNVTQSGGFDLFYRRMTAYRFRADRTAEVLYEEVMRNTRILEKKAVFLVIHEWDRAAEGIVRELSRNHVAVMVYLITDADMTTEVTLSRTTVVKIAVHADLTEVL